MLMRSPVGPRGRSNATGLFEAIDEDANVAAVKKLIAAGADVSAKNKDGRTVLRMAVIKGRADLVKALLAAKANPNVADALGETPLMSAAKAGNEEIVKLLLGAGANPNVQTSAPLAPDQIGRGYSLKNPRGRFAAIRTVWHGNALRCRRSEVAPHQTYGTLTNRSCVLKCERRQDDSSLEIQSRSPIL